MVLSYGGSLWWYFVYVDPKDSWSWTLWCRIALVKNDSSVFGREEEWEPLLGVTRMCMYKLSSSLAKYQDRYKQNSVENRIRHGYVLMLCIWYIGNAPRNWHRNWHAISCTYIVFLKYQTFRSHFVTMVPRCSYLPSQCLPSLVKYGSSFQTVSYCL